MVATKAFGSASRNRLRQVPTVIWMLATLILFFGVMAPGFLTPSNFLNVIRQSAPLLILGTGLTMVILTQGIDLSVGAVMGLVGVTMALLLSERGLPFPAAALGAIAVGVLCGSITGFLVSRAKVPPFIATLGMQSMATGLGLTLTQGSSVAARTPVLRWLGQGIVLGIPVPFWIALIVFGISFVLLYRTRFGAYIFALGGNEEAASLSGVATRRWKWMVYAYSGLLAALAGILLAARVESGHPTAGAWWDFDAIAATILGGTSFEEGKGGLGGTVLGVALIILLRNGLNVMAINSQWQHVIIGVVVILAIVLDVLLRHEEHAE